MSALSKSFCRILSLHDDIDADIVQLEAELEGDEEDDWEYLLDPAVDAITKCKDQCFIAKLFQTSALGQFDIMQLE